MISNITSLADALPAEMARVRVVLGYYKALGAVGAIGAMFIEQDLQAADKAVMSGDVVQMLRIFETLKGIN